MPTESAFFPDPPPPSVPLEPLVEEDLDSRSIDELNRDSPLQPVFFGYDSAEVSLEGQELLRANAELLQAYTPWIVTIEGWRKAAVISPSR